MSTPILCKLGLHEWTRIPFDVADHAKRAGRTRLPHWYVGGWGNDRWCFRCGRWPMTVESQPTAARFWRKVDRQGPVGSLYYGRCWVWTAATNSDGYGLFSLDARSQKAHRVAYLLTRGPIPVGMQIDHLCGNRRCVNPWHLEPVTAGENIARGIAKARSRHSRRSKTHCSRGHEYTSENTVVHGGKRDCRICNRQRVSEYEARKRAGREVLAREQQ